MGIFRASRRHSAAPDAEKSGFETFSSAPCQRDLEFACSAVELVLAR
jgi:hypothetical protein